MFEREIRQQIIQAGQRLYTKNFVASNDGNISARLDERSIIITPTGICKGDLTTDQLIKVDNTGNVISGDLKPTSEMKMHLAVYNKRKDVKAIVHAHPRNATAFAVAGLKLDKLTLPEVIFSLGKISSAEYGTPSTEQVPRSVEKVIDSSDAVLLANHGALTVGDTVMGAYFKMETLEHFASITLAARALGGERELNEQEEKELFKIRSEVFGKKGIYCTDCGACEAGSNAVHDKLPDCVVAYEQQKAQEQRSKIGDMDELVQYITNEIVNRING